MTIDVSSLASAISALADAVGESTRIDADRAATQSLRDVVHAGVIQSFEFTYELAWKTLRRVMAAKLGDAALTGVDKQELFRLAAKHGWLHDPEKWFEFNDARNMTSHAYDRVIAEDIYVTAVAFLGVAQALHSELQKRVAP